VENYVPERINPVDRAILRLGAAEIMFDKEIPVPVAINEAVDISQKFASNDSSKFINGILDKISKTATQITTK
jgi:N utilization substance protein B